MPRSRRQLCGLLAIVLCLLAMPYEQNTSRRDADPPDADGRGVALSHPGLAPQPLAIPGRSDLRGVIKRAVTTAPIPAVAQLAATALRTVTRRWGVEHRTGGDRVSVAVGEAFRGRAPPGTR